MFPEFKYQKCRLPEEVISEISRQISDVLKARGSWEETVMEKGREQFLDLVRTWLRSLRLHSSSFYTRLPHYLNIP